MTFVLTDRGGGFYFCGVVDVGWDREVFLF